MMEVYVRLTLIVDDERLKSDCLFYCGTLMEYGLVAFHTFVSSLNE